MSDVLIKAEHVSKRFCLSLKRSLWYGIQDVVHSLSPWAEDTAADEDVFRKPPLRRDEFWALNDVSFEVRRGECLGLIGHNGAGKSTLLKILNGLFRPDAGRITMRGRIGAMIELGAGFNPFLTGRENIYNQATLLGFTRSEIEQKFDEIVEFSEVGDFLDMPLQNYSSGMKVRLGFAVSSQLEPDILLLDEVLAVGDVGFRAKCMQRMSQLIEKSAVVYVSHAMPSVARVASQILHLHQGETRILTTSLDEGMGSYFATFSTGKETRVGTGQVEIESVRATCDGRTAAAGESLLVRYGMSVSLEIECSFQPGCLAATIQLLFWNQELVPIMDVVGKEMRRVPIHPNSDGRCGITTTIPELLFNSGRYLMSITVLSVDGMTTYRKADQILEIQMESNHGGGAAMLLCTDWLPSAEGSAFSVKRESL